MFCLFENSFFSPSARNLCVNNERCVRGWGVSGLEALNTFFTLNTQALCSQLSWPSFLLPGNQGVCLGGGCGGGVSGSLKSETMCHNIRGFFFSPGSFHFSPVSSIPVFSILNAMVVIVYWRGAAVSEMGDLFL